MKKRKDCVFGLHFDFHAAMGQKNIGENYDEASWVKMLDEVKPDFIQVDTKGHAGVSSYPTKVGNAAPEMRCDILKNVRRITKERGVSLYAHHSGVWDKTAAALHPEWGALREDGSCTGETHLFSDYSEKLLIPQIKELAEYGLDGVWVDGDCWSVIRDYGVSLAKFAAQTGNSDAKSREYADFLRERFLEYVEHYAKAVHAQYPDFEIASNWMYTSFCPENPRADVDFISGDLLPDDSVCAARIEARLVSNQNKPWDLMAWGFNIQNGFFVEKSAEQLKQEAAAILMNGGGVQVYQVQNVGKVSVRSAGAMKAVAEFVRARAELVGKRPYNRTGWLFSTEGYRFEKEMIYNNNGDARAYANGGDILAAADTRLNFDGGFTHWFSEHLEEYDNICVHNFGGIEAELKEKLLGWTERGGKLFLAGTYAARAFAEELGLPKETERGVRYLLHGEESCGLDTEYLCVNGGRGALYGDYHCENKCSSAYFVRDYGKGKIGGLLFDLGKDYKVNRARVMEKFLENVFKEIGFTREIEFVSPCAVDVTVQRGGNVVYIDLLNLNGVHGDARVRSFENIPPIYGVAFSYACPPPKRVRLVADEGKVEWNYADGKLNVALDKLDIHNAVALEY
ncbi:MAG: hypothetical protein DBX59_11570 [Bacillota bacterium]|nr:MAG: hypothetical protein DBX59_11570 [Bacillota bacterium]